MRILVIALLFFTLLSQAGCKKEVGPPPPPPPDTPKYHTSLDIRWIEWYTPDTCGAYFLDPYFWDEYVVFCTEMPVKKNLFPTMRVFNKSNGTKHHLWIDQFKDLSQGYTDYFPDWNLCGAGNHMAVHCASNRLFGWNLATGSLQWMVAHAPWTGLARFSTVYGKPFHTVKAGNQTISQLVRIEPETGAKQEIVTVYAEDQERLWLLPPSGWIDPNNDTILLFQGQGYRNSTEGFAKIYAFNMNKKTFLWKDSLVVPFGSTTMNPPMIIRNKVIFVNASAIHCLDIPTGKTLWHHEFTNPLKGFNYKPLYVDGRIYQRSTEDVMAIDAHTGTILWEYKDKINNLEGGSMAYYKGNLYFTAEDGYDPYFARYLFCLEGATGNLIWKDKGPHEYSGMAFGVIVDPTTGYLYATDAYRMMCIDLNNTPKKP